MKNNIFFTICFSLLSLMGVSQDCTVSVTAVQDSIACGDCVELVAQGEIYDTLMSEDFNTGTLDPGWSTTSNVTFGNPCGPTLDGTPAAWFGYNPDPRDMVTVGYDLTCGGDVCFDLDFANDEDLTNCEDPDQSDEGVYFQYSTDNGATWVTIFYFDPTLHDFMLYEGYYDWDRYCFEIPPGAQTTNTMLRWHQEVITAEEWDHWGIDNVEILGAQCNNNYYYDWLADGSIEDEDTTICLDADSQTYDVIFTNGIDDTCSASQTIFSTLDAGINTNDTIICGIEDYDIVANPQNGSGTYDYLWNTGETSNTISNATTGEYIVTVSDQTYPNCSVSDTVNFEMYPIPDVNFTADPLCQGALTYFTDETTIPTGYTLTSWDWDFDDLGATSTDQNPSHEFSGVGSYDVTLTVESGEGCSSDTTIQIDVEPSPFADFDFENACEGEEIFFENQSLGNYENSQWIFETAENDTVLSTDASFTFPDDGNYTVTLIIEKSDGACSDTLTETVTVNPEPNIDFTTNIQIGEPPLEVEFYNQSTGAISYLWDFMNGNTSNSINDTVFETFTEPGEYPVTLYGTSAAGCESSYSLVITVEFEDLVIQMPNIFTPNGDGTNDEYYINYVQAKETISDFEIVFLNRWGNVLRTFNDPDFKWDGTTNGGTKVSDGTYFYRVNISTVKGQTIEDHGPIQVVNQEK